MEEFIIAGRPISILSKQEIDDEIERANLDRREANFSGKSLKFLSLAEKNLDYGLNLENSWISGNVFMAGTSINGNINMANAVVDGSFSFGQGKLMGSLILIPLAGMDVTTWGMLLIAVFSVVLL